MNTTAYASNPRTDRIIGNVLTWIAALFQLLDGGMKLFKPQVVVDATLALGFPASSIVGMGIVLIMGTIAYLVPRTALFGAIFVTAYLGGAVAAHVRVKDPLFSHVLFPVYLAAVLWAGLALRDPRLRRLLFDPSNDAVS